MIAAGVTLLSVGILAVGAGVPIAVIGTRRLRPPPEYVTIEIVPALGGAALGGTF